MTKEQRKEQAVKYMKELGIYQPYITSFLKKDQVCEFVGFGGYWIDKDSELYQKIKQVEKEHNVTVYAVTHEFLEFGECYSFLIVTDYEEEWDDLICGSRNQHGCFAYVWNTTVDWCSEFGSVGIYSFGGGIKRIS